MQNKTAQTNQYIDTFLYKCDLYQVLTGTKDAALSVELFGESRKLKWLRDGKDTKTGTLAAADDKIDELLRCTIDDHIAEGSQ